MIAVDVAPMTEVEKDALIVSCLARFTEGMHQADPELLRDERARVEYMEASPLVLRLRAIVAAEQATRLLVKLGDNADAMADRLRALGIKGARLLSNVCPLAVYLGTQGITAYVSREEICVPVDDDTTVHVPVPAATAVFVERFDGGVYLDLIDVDLTDAALEGAGA
jgi:hypothetical protein